MIAVSVSCLVLERVVFGKLSLDHSEFYTVAVLVPEAVHYVDAKTK